MRTADITVQAQRLPGVGWRYSVPADQGRQLMIVVEDRGARHLVVVDPSLDEPLMTVRLSDTNAKGLQINYSCQFGCVVLSAGVPVTV